jgi:hypothetical protein
LTGIMSPTTTDRRAELEPGRGRLGWWLLAAAIVVAGAAVRFAASLGNFWLDEIWSWAMAQSLSSAGDIVFRLRHDNNHFLNTWFLYVLGPGRPWVDYRLPAVVAGTAAIALAGWSVRRAGRGAVFVTMALFASSYLMIHYSSEARGYGPLVFFSLASFALLDRGLKEPRRGGALLFGASSVLGFLAQPIFVYEFVSLAGWAAWHWKRQRMPWGPWFAWMARWFTLPGLFAAALYAVNLSGMQIGGGLNADLGDVVVSTLSLTAGGPATGIGAGLVGLVVAVAFGAEVVRLWRAGDDLWVFALSVVLVAPVLLLVVSGRPDLYPRYFLISVTFLLLLFGPALVRLWQRGTQGKLVAAALLVAFLAGNGLHTRRLLDVGRGSYAQAVELIQRETPGAAVAIGSDHPFRHPLVLEFYRQRGGRPEQQFVYSPPAPWPAEGPQWLVLHGFEAEYHPAATITDPSGNEYQLVRTYPYAGLSGWHLALYRNRRDIAGETHRE